MEATLAPSHERCRSVLIVDDHPLYRSALRELLHGLYETVREAASGEEAVREALQHAPDVVVMDIDMPGIGGVEALRRIKRERPATAVLVVSAFAGDDQIMQAIEAGADGYLVKTEPAPHLLEAIEQVADGRGYLPLSVARRVLGRRTVEPVAPPASRGLTAREQEIVRLVVAGKRNRDIARALGISERTVANHLNAIYAKLAVSSRSEAVARALREGLAGL